LVVGTIADMPSKPLKVNVPIAAETAEAAIAALSELFLRPGRSGVKVVRDPTEFRVADLCKPLLEDWKNGKFTFSKGEVVLTFTSGKLALDADLLVFMPEQGDRLLYSGRALASAPPQQLPIVGLADDDRIAHLVQPIQTVTEILAELTANQRAVESRLQQLLGRNSTLDACFGRMCKGRSQKHYQLRRRLLTSNCKRLWGHRRLPLPKFCLAK
jgi:hypothetical protein